MTWQPTDKQVEAALDMFRSKAPDAACLLEATIRRYQRNAMRAALIAAHEAGEVPVHHVSQEQFEVIAAQVRAEAFEEAARLVETWDGGCEIDSEAAAAGLRALAKDAGV